jgi:hypothetical protein
MIIDPVQLLIKTAANYIAFKTVKSTVDYCSNGSVSFYQSAKAVECVFCLNVWSDAPKSCPHCNCKVMKKLYRDYDYRKDENQNILEIDSHLTIEEKHDRNRR